MSDPDDPVVKPYVSPRTPRLGLFSLLVSSESDLKIIDSLLGIDRTGYRPLFNSFVFADSHREIGFSIAGPVVGAPYAVMILETLIAWGVKKIVFLGWCGAILQGIKIGDVIVPNGALIDEGTSRHYNSKTGARSKPSPIIAERIKTALTEKGLKYREGLIWTTDGVYRETPRKVGKFRALGAMAVEMELSALFTVGSFHGVEVGSLLVVSDILSDDEWHPGFKDKRFKTDRMAACQAITEASSAISGCEGRGAI